MYIYIYGKKSYTSAARPRAQANAWLLLLLSLQTLEHQEKSSHLKFNQHLFPCFFWLKWWLFIYRIWVCLKITCVPPIQIDYHYFVCEHGRTVGIAHVRSWQEQLQFQPSVFFAIILRFEDQHGWRWRCSWDPWVSKIFESTGEICSMVINSRFLKWRYFTKY